MDNSVFYKDYQDVRLISNITVRKVVRVMLGLFRR